MKRLLGACSAAAGLFIILMQVLWTTGERRDLPLLPAWAESVLVFTLGLTGLAMIGIGIRLVRKG